MLSDRLRYLREKNGYTQQTIAQVLNIDRSTYTYYETGKTKPDVEVLKKLARLYRITLDQLVDHRATLKDTSSTYKNRKNEPAPLILTNQEKKMLAVFKKLRPSQKKVILDEMVRMTMQEDS